MRSFASFKHARIIGVFDKNPDRMKAFAAHWNLPKTASLDALFELADPDTVFVNLTNPSAHAVVNTACLNAGFHVYSEKPLATDMADANAVHAMAARKGLHVASAPCSVLGEAAQIMAQAVRDDTAGTIRLIYAELDDGFIPQAPYKDWKTESGAPWPYVDEFQTGCTLEHAGYYLSWLIAIFGPVKTVVAASAEVLPDKPGAGTPDFSVATLFFETGPAVRLTCSIAAPHDHRIRMIGDKGVISLKKAWANSAPVRFHKRMILRRRLIENPIGKRLRLRGKSHPKVARWGAAEMNFALGPVEMAEAIKQKRTPRLAGDFALHLNEVTLAIQNAGHSTGAQEMTTTCTPLDPMEWTV